jgi:hypothetical protein
MNDSHNTIPSSGQEVATHPSRLRTFGLSALAVLLYLALIDAAVETFVGHSPLRWIIGGTVAAYVALSALLWRKLSWAAKASLSLFVLFALMAFAAWWPEGSDSPVTLLQQPTSTLLSAATILGILLAGWILVRLKFLPWPARGALVLVAAYGVAAFVVGIMARTPYAALLHGGSLWEKLPFWLQGAFIGAVVVLPAALLLQLVTGVSQIRAGQLREWCTQVLALGLCGAMVASGTTSAAGPFASTALVHDEHIAYVAPVKFVDPCAGVAGVAAEAPSGIDAVAPGASQAGKLGAGAGGGMFGELGGSEPAQAPASKQLDPATARCQQAATTVAEGYGKIAALQQGVPADDYSVAAKASEFGGDVQKTFEFVRDQVRLDAYPGVMRGSQGALMGLAGNPTDKGLLLADLLQHQGLQVRFARGILSDAEIDTLEAQVMAPTPPRRPPPPLPDTVLSELGITRDQLQAALKAQRAKVEPRVRKMVDDTVSNAVTSGTKLADLIANSGVTLGGSGIPPEWAGELKPHYWLQVQQNGSWVDLDPSLPSLAVGSHLGSADSGFSDASLPDDLYATVTFRLVLTTLRAGTLTDTTLLEEKRRVVDLVAQPVSLDVLPAESVNDIKEVKSFAPRFALGDSRTPGTSFSLTGEDSTEAVRLRLEVNSSVAGQQPRVYRRLLVDRLVDGPNGGPPAIDSPFRDPASAAYAFMTSLILLVAPTELNESFDAARMLDNIVALRPVYEYLATPEGQRQGIASPQTSLFPLDLLQFVCRDAWFGAILSKKLRTGVRFFADRPDIVMERISFSSPHGEAAARMEFDIVENGKAAVAADWPVAARANIARGMIDQQIERDVLGRTQSTGTPEVIAAAQQSRVPVTVLKPSDIQKVGTLAIPPRFRSALQDTLSTGEIAVAPDHLVPVNGQDQFGWWAVDPSNGNTVGRMSHGAGQAMTDRSILERAKESMFCFPPEHYVVGTVVTGISCAVEWGVAAGSGAMCFISGKSGAALASCVGQAICDRFFGFLFGQTISELSGTGAVGEVVGSVYNLLGFPGKGLCEGAE